MLSRLAATSTAVGDDEQAGIGQLALEASRVVHGDERVAVSGDQLVPRSGGARAVSSGWSATSCAIAGSSRRHAPSPRTGSSRARLAAQRGSSRSIPSPVQRAARRSRVLPLRYAHEQRACGCGRPAAGGLQRGHRAHRKTDEQEGVKPELVDEGEDVVDEHVVGEAAARVPARPARGRAPWQIDEETPRGAELGGEVRGAGGGAAVEQHDRWSCAEYAVQLMSRPLAAMQGIAEIMPEGVRARRTPVITKPYRSALPCRPLCSDPIWACGPCSFVRMH